MALGLRRVGTCALLVVLGPGLLACGGDDEPDTPAATLGTQRTTTTEARTVEEEVEAAYLRSWDVYTEAVRTFDTSTLEVAYVGEALASRLDEVERLRDANTPARMDVDHDISVTVADAETAIVVDDYYNRSVLLDGTTGEPIEAEPNEVVKREYLMRLVDGAWKVAVVTAR